VITGWDASDRTGDLSLQIAYGLAYLSKQSVLLVDADFQAPKLHDHLRTTAGPGLGEWIEGTQGLREVIRPPSQGTFFFMPAGTSAALKSVGLSVPAWTERLAELRKFQRIVVHVGPLNENAAATVITAESDAVILALAAGIRRRDEAESLQRQVDALQAKLLGVVLTHR
jgi:MinD-like ATPase involved in chromosome partitioning or flagellar assembly